MVPHWQPELVIPQQTETEVTEFQNQPPTAQEVADAYADVTLEAVFGLYKLQQEMDVAVGDRQNVTRGALLKNIRNGLRFFAQPVKVTDVTADLVQRTKAAMFTAGLGRRTVKNYLGAIRGMMLWFFDSEYGRTHEKPPRFDTAFSVANATRTDIKTHGAPELKAMLAAASERTRLFAMLALNCGMYQSDIGRLTLDEINLTDGYIFWDREKEPQNPFRVRHDLWPETLTLVRKFIQQPSDKPRLYADFRKGQAENIDCSRLAFVDRNGLPLYRVRENGDSYDKISDAWKDLKEKNPAVPRFKDIRKSTNQRICELVAGQIVGDDPHRLEAVGEISKEFLAQKTPTLARLYRQSGMKFYDRMNRFLQVVGNEWRKAGIFEPLQQEG